jgi:hypothetical protein
MASRVLTDHSLKVLPELVGAPLASPFRRAVALALDCALIALPSAAVAVLVAAIALWASDPRALRAIWTVTTSPSGAGRPATARYRQALKDLAPLLVRLDRENLPRDVRDAVECGDLEGAADALSRRELLVAMALGESAAPQMREGMVRVPLERAIPETLRGVAAYGVAALYFGVMTRGRRGATFGKRIAGIRVVALSGERLSVAESLERFVGYLHVPATLGLSLIYLWHDPNRRLPHDRVARTAVLRNVRTAREVGK